MKKFKKVLFHSVLVLIVISSVFYGFAIKSQADVLQRQSEESLKLTDDTDLTSLYSVVSQQELLYEKLKSSMSVMGESAMMF